MPLECHLGDIPHIVPISPPPKLWKPHTPLVTLEGGIHYLIVGFGVTTYGMAMVGLLIILWLLFPAHGVAADLQYPLSIPSECIDLAQRKGQPLVMETKTQAIKARAKLWALRNSEQGVKECRDAVKKIEDELKAK